MILVDAEDLTTGEHVELYVTRPVKFGATFRQKGKRYRRLVSQPARPTFGPGGFKSGPVEMWTEPPHGRGPVLAEKYSKDGFPLMENMRDIRNYEKQTADAGRPVNWTR